MAIVVADVGVTYGNGHRAVDRVSLAVARGEVFGLLGANGAGKTTLIKVLATLLRSTSGRVRVLGRDPAAEAAAIKRRLGVVPQENNLDVDLDVRANLIFHCRYFGVAATEARRRADRWLDVLGLADKAQEEVVSLSGGSKRKLMLAKAFLTDPELLLLDEPTTGLDPEIRAAIWRQIRDFRAGGGTVFLSTHHMEEAERLCGRVAVMQRGRIVASDTPAGLARAHGGPGLEEAFQRIAEAAR